MLLRDFNLAIVLRLLLLFNPFQLQCSDKVVLIKKSVLQFPCSAQRWSFMHCCSFLMHSWYKLCNVDTVELNRYCSQQLLSARTLKTSNNNFIYPHSVISPSYISWINSAFILDRRFFSFSSLDAKPNVQNTKCPRLKRTLNR